jgi:ATP-binding cassette, subfamily B, bacterial PglK
MRSENSPAYLLLKSEVLRKKKTLALNFFGGGITAVLEITGIGLVLPLIFVIVYPDKAPSIPLLGNLFNQFDITTQKDLTITLSIFIVITIFTKSIYMMKFYSWQAKVFAEWKSELSYRMMKLYVLSDFAIHMEKDPSEITRNLTLPALAFDQFIKQGLSLIIHLTVALAIAVLISLALPRETLISSIALIGAAIFIYLVTKKKLGQSSKEEYELSRLRTQCINQSLGAIKEAKILGKSNYFLNAFADLEFRIFTRKGKQDQIAAFPPLVLEFVIISCFLAIIVHIVFVVETAEQSLGILGLLAAAMFRLLPVVVRAIGNLNILSLGKPVFELMANEFAENEHRVETSDKTTSQEGLNWEVLELRNISYSYPDGTVALSNINIKFRRTEFIGIVGPSGCGKSTLMLIVLGLVAPTSGEVLLDGVPLKDSDIVRKWQNNFGFVPQGTFFCSGSLATNVAFADDEPDYERVEYVMREAALSDYLDRLDNGVLSDVGEYGLKLSGGQKQRLVIARAMYKNPSILAFDEATSSLDQKSEAVIVDNLLKIKGNRTIFTIAHRMASLVNCDRLMFIEQGALVGSGPYRELIEKCPSFAEIALPKDLKNK